MPPKKITYPCGTCNKSASGQRVSGVTCTLCGFWHHLTEDCMPWHTDEDLELIKKLCKTKSCWTCGKCDVIMTKINERFGKIEREVEAVQEKVTTMEAEQERVKEELKTAADWRTSMENKVHNNTNNVKAATMNEAEMRQNKKKMSSSMTCPS